MTTKTPVKEDKAQESGKLAPRRENPLHTLQEEMNRVFDEFKHGFTLHKPLWLEPLVDFNAKVDMKDNHNEIIVTAELPGVDLKDVEVTLQDKTLSIKGEKHSEKEETDKNYYRMERSYGSFYRILPLPCAVKKDKVEAIFKDGVLKVTLSKTPEAASQETKIQVNAG